MLNISRSSRNSSANSASTVSIAWRVQFWDVRGRICPNDWPGSMFLTLRFENTSIGVVVVQHRCRKSSLGDTALSCAEIFTMNFRLSNLRLTFRNATFIHNYCRCRSLADHWGGRSNAQKAGEVQARTNLFYPKQQSCCRAICWNRKHARTFLLAVGDFKYILGFTTIIVHG